MPRKPGPRASLRSRWLGEMLREMRKDRKVHLAEAAEFIQRDQGMLSRYESGKYPIRRAEVQALLDFYGESNEDTRESLLKLCDEVWRTGWWDQHANELGSNFVNVPWLESQAQSISSYQNMLVDGLLQTRNYADALIRYFSTPGTSEDGISNLVDIRMERAKILASSSPANMTMVIEESVLRTNMGSPEVQLEQLSHLCHQARQDHVDIHVMSMEDGLHDGVDGSFYIYGMPADLREIALASTQGGDLYIEGPEVERLQKRWNNLIARALTLENSENLIESIIKEKNAARDQMA